MLSFEYFFGLFGLISGDPRLKRKPKPEPDWHNSSLIDHVRYNGPDDDPRITLYNTSFTAKQMAAGATPTGSKVGPESPPPSYSSSKASSAPRGDGPLFVHESSSVGSIASVSSDGSIHSNSSLIKSASELASDSKKTSTNKVKSSWINVTKARKIYSRLVCLFLWLSVLRLSIAFWLEQSILTLDLDCMGLFKMHFAIPALCMAIQAAATSLIFIRYDNRTEWLVPFHTSKDYLVRSRSNFKPRIEDYSKRVRVSVNLALSLATASSISICVYLVAMASKSPTMTAAGQVMKSQSSGVTQQQEVAMPESGLTFEQLVFIILLVCDAIWVFYTTYICFMVAFYFNLICSIMRARFAVIGRIVEELSESDTTKTTNQTRKITTLYLEHNEACELLDESNQFWQYLIFFTYFTYIPAYCYCLYNLFFTDFEDWPQFITWVFHFHTGVITLLISFSAAGVSTEIATFLHRVRGLTIGYSCYDLFAITNASMSNTAAACASYFLIVADFSRSTFNQELNNASISAAIKSAREAATSVVLQSSIGSTTGAIVGSSSLSPSSGSSVSLSSSLA